MRTSKWMSTSEAIPIRNNLGHVAFTIPKGSIGFITDWTKRFYTKEKYLELINRGEEPEHLYVQFPEGPIEFYKAVGKIEPAPKPEFEEAINTLNQFKGHHCSAVWEYQFDIKIRQAIRPPKQVEDHYGDHEISQELEFRMNDELSTYMGEMPHSDCGLKQDVEIINDWSVAGRSGGHLILRMDTDVDPEDYEVQRDEILSELQEKEFDLEVLEDDLKNVEAKAIDAALYLEWINRNLEDAKKGFVDFMQSEEAWLSFIEEE